MEGNTGNNSKRNAAFGRFLRTEEKEPTKIPFHFLYGGGAYTGYMGFAMT